MKHITGCRITIYINVVMDNKIVIGIFAVVMGIILRLMGYFLSTAQKHIANR